MDTAALTAAYLDEVRRSGASPDELTCGLAADPQALFNLFAPDAAYLPRPVFADRGQLDLLYADVETVRALLVSLPDRLYGGDFTAFARAAGAEGYELTAITASRSDPVNPQARADLYADGTGFRVMEFNLGSALGGIENADLCRVMLKHPVLARFAAAHGLGYLDTMREQVLKPALRYGGQDVLPGWHAQTSQDRWRDQLTQAMNGPFVLQRRIRPVPELFPGSDGELVPWIVAWGLYTGVNGYGGVVTRAGTVESGLAVLNVSAGGHLGCCLHTGGGSGPAVS